MLSSDFPLPLLFNDNHSYNGLRLLPIEEATLPRETAINKKLYAMNNTDPINLSDLDKYSGGVDTHNLVQPGENTENTNNFAEKTDKITNNFTNFAGNLMEFASENVENQAEIAEKTDKITNNFTNFAGNLMEKQATIWLLLAIMMVSVLIVVKKIVIQKFTTLPKVHMPSFVGMNLPSHREKA